REPDHGVGGSTEQPEGGRGALGGVLEGGVRRLGVDPGSRRIGLALSDESATLASPHKTLARAGAQATVEAVAREVRDTGAIEVVVGLPLRSDGSEGPAARRARAFADAVSAAAGVPAVMWDERLSTVAAERALREAGVGARRRRSVVDQAAAVVVLQSYLEHLARRAWPDEEDPAEN